MRGLWSLIAPAFAGVFLLTGCSAGQSGPAGEPSPTAGTNEPTAVPKVSPTPPRPPELGSLSVEEKIAFVSNRDGNDEIYSMNFDGSDMTRLTNNSARDRSPAWSPDRSRIAFVSDRDGDNEIYAMRGDGSEPHRLTRIPSDDTAPSWSPDGSLIAFQSNRGGNIDVYVMREDGSEQSRLTTDFRRDLSPVWAPDSSKIAYVSDRTGAYHIYTTNIDGTSQTRLFKSTSGDQEPSWSPDGQQIAFVSRRDGNAEIYVMSVDGSILTRLTDHIAEDTTPVWSPDGSRVAFVSLRDGNPEIYVIQNDGTGLARLTNDPAADKMPSWSSPRLEGEDGAEVTPPSLPAAAMPVLEITSFSCQTTGLYITAEGGVRNVSTRLLKGLRAELILADSGGQRIFPLIDPDPTLSPISPTSLAPLDDGAFKFGPFPDISVASSADISRCGVVFQECTDECREVSSE